METRRDAATSLFGFTNPLQKIKSFRSVSWKVAQDKSNDLEWRSAEILKSSSLLDYGVMVAQQVLVLFVQVRILIIQL